MEVDSCSPPKTDVFGGLTVGDMFGPRGAGISAERSDALGAVAVALLASGQTAVGVTDRDGELAGLLTENDIVRAYFEGISPAQSVEGWLSGSKARAPGGLLPRLTVQPSTPLAEVAESMVANAISGDCACHHVAVQESGKFYGVLSSHDMVRVLCRPEMWEHRKLVHQVWTEDATKRDALEVATTMTVRDVMKPREQVFTCPPSDSMKDVLQVLLMTQQNSALIVDEEGIHGIVTPRDAMKAFSDGVTRNFRIADWLRGLQMGIGNRNIAHDSGLIDAAAMMTARNVNHLIVVVPGSMEAIGVLSSLDLVLRTRANAAAPRSETLWGGLPVGELLVQPMVCKKGTRILEAARMMASSGRTSALVVSLDSGPPLGFLTDTDITCAFIEDCSQDATVEEWLAIKKNHSEMAPPHLMVLPSTPLTEAASSMLCAADPGRTCHHLVVRSRTGHWLGIFSALDVVRALMGLRSGLEVAKTGVDQTKVSAVMKPYTFVPKCSSGNTIRDALSTLVYFCQNAGIVVDGDGRHSLITLRCALQALAEGVSPSCSVSAWVQRQQHMDALRKVPPDTRLLDAAVLMTENSLHHLVVVEPDGQRPVGVLSALDVVRSVASIQCHCPFMSLAWLRNCKGPKACALHAA